jgi:hypothetical protein
LKVEGPRPVTKVTALKATEFNRPHGVGVKEARPICGSARRTTLACLSFPFAQCVFKLHQYPSFVGVFPGGDFGISEVWLRGGCGSCRTLPESAEESV